MRRTASRICVLLGIGCIALPLFVEPLAADVQFTPSQIPDGPRFILVSGTFHDRDNIDAFSDVVRAHNPQFVTFNSKGGNLIKAMELGRLIRQHRLSTAQIRKLECASACALAYLGGVHRAASPGSIGVHKSSFEKTSQLSVKDAVSAIQRITAEMVAYIVEMGADPRLIQLALRYEANDVRYLSRSEMAQYRITTPADDDQSPPTTASTPEPREGAK